MNKKILKEFYPTINLKTNTNLATKSTFINISENTKYKSVFILKI